jgi:alpha-maltose-1-phosphate synthase
VNVSVLTIGRFHHFDLGRQLLRLRHGLELFTTNPRAKVDSDLRPYVRTHSRFRIPFAVATRLGLGRHVYWLDELLLKDFGSWVAENIDASWSDVFHGLDSTGPAAGRRIKQAGKLWVCDRGSTHILTQKKLIVEEHRAWRLSPPKFAPERLERCVAEYEESHAITVPSHFVKRSFVENGIDGERVFVCPYGVDLSEFRQAPKQDDVFRVLHVGQINARKGIGYLLEAVEPLARSGRVEVWLTGAINADVQPLLDRYRGVFEYKGIWPRNELWRLYSQASVLVLASIEEGLALVQAQAMACGLPVIATTHTGAEDLFTDGVEGFVVPIRDPQAIRERVEWMMDNREKRDEMAAAALARVKTLGGWDRYGERVASVYQELAKRHGVKLHDAT